MWLFYGTFFDTPCEMIALKRSAHLLVIVDEPWLTADVNLHDNFPMRIYTTVNLCMCLTVTLIAMNNVYFGKGTRLDVKGETKVGEINIEDDQVVDDYIGVDDPKIWHGILNDTLNILPRIDLSQSTNEPIKIIAFNINIPNIKVDIKGNVAIRTV